MFVKSFISVAALAAFTVACGLSVSTASAQIMIPTVPIGNPGNAPDPTTGFGAVAYTYNIGTTEVTNAQYAAFLNAKAASDPWSLYDTNMAGFFGGITRSGSPGSYTYSTMPGRESNPVIYVTYWSAARFANWLHNGQGSGDTETGAYTLTAGGISANTISRNAGWQWAVTNENEWYKAAYLQPASAGGDSDNYWLYPTSSNGAPTSAQANISGNGIHNTTPVGSYAGNFHGTFDMGGNVWEWNESIIGGSSRGLRGGAYGSVDNDLRAGYRTSFEPGSQLEDVGFRVSQSVAPAQITIPTVPIGNPGNAPDPTTGFGSVAYTYNIGTTEVTNAQYAAFLNAKAASDPFNLYNTDMGTAPYGGITRAGSPGSYTYALISGRESHPVSYVSFWDATRFANWLHNGQGSGDTETGAYTLTPGGISDNTITRNAGAVWAVTSEDEWYKAAYHQPASAGGDSDNYWLFPTQSNTVTTAQANYNGAIGNTKSAGSYSANYYGTFDMGGNVWEWNEALLGGRGIRGGYFNTVDITLRANTRPANSGGNNPTFENFTHGFRVSRLFVCNPPTISAPLGSTICTGQPMALTASAPGATAYQWLKDLVEIPGATQATLNIPIATAINAGSYRVRATFPCGTRTSDPIELTICAADFSCDGFVDGFDYDGFVNAFETGGPGADFNGDGFADAFDYDDFVTAFEAGC